MPPSDDRNRIEDLKQSLYSRNAPDIRSRRRLRISDTAPDVRHDWGDASHESASLESMLDEGEGRTHRMSFVTKFFIASAVFCLAALGIGAYIFFNGGNFISSNNIAIDMSGPVSVPGGAPVSFGITITNKNSVTLKGAGLTVHYPAGSTDPTDTTQSLDSQQIDLGDIAPGGSVTKNVSAVIFGEQNSQKEITADVNYTISGSNSVFTKEASYDVVVNASPVDLSVDAPQSVLSGQPFDLTVNLKSNSSNTLKDVIMKATYPFGWSYSSSSFPPSSSDDSVWSFGDIPPGSQRTIVISGSLTGEDSDVRAFHFAAGAKSPSNPNIIGTAFVETEQSLTIAKPFVSLSLALNDDSTSGDYVGSFGKPIDVNVKWSNNLPETLSNVVVTAHLSGNAYDKNNVSASSGFFQSATDDVVWDQRSDPDLAAVPSGGSGTLSFTVTPSEASGASIVDPGLTISVSASGDRTQSASAPFTTGAVARDVKVVGDVVLAGRILRTQGAFQNTGPIPPVAEQTTTYTVDWTATPGVNAVSNAAVTATLPPGVDWTGQTSPSSEDISYDKNSGTVTWNIGSIPAPTPGNPGTREVQFQVSLQPSVSQVGSAPILVDQATLSGTDAWTGASIESQQGYLTTSFSTDPAYKVGDENVAPK